MKMPGKLTVALVLVTLAQGCDPVGMVSGDEIDRSLSAMKAARETIMTTRPKASQLLVDKLNVVLGQNGIKLSLRAEDVEKQLPSRLTSGAAPTTCPYLGASSGATSKSCRSLVEAAVQAAVRSAPSLTETHERAAQSNFWGLKEEELGWVKGWAGEAVLSGIDTAAVHALSLLRNAKACDQTPSTTQKATDLGEAQGKALLEAAEKSVLPTTPTTICNTDIIAASVRAEAEGKVAGFVASNPICAGYPAVAVPPQAEQQRREGIEEGIRQAYEALRVRLVATWACTPRNFNNSTTPTVPAVPTPGGNGSSSGGSGSSGSSGSGGSNGWGSGWGDTGGGNGWGGNGWGSGWGDSWGGGWSDFAFGEPLVVDLTGDGVRFTGGWASFDLAANGDLVKMPVLARGCALLALDLDGNGRIDSGAELLGNASACGKRRCVDGIEALTAHDGNGDGVIDRRDAVFGRLVLWHDANADGKSEPRELVPLADTELGSIQLGARLDLAWSDGRGNAALRALTFTRKDGTTGTIHDVWFGVRFDARMPRAAASTGIVSTLPERSR